MKRLASRAVRPRMCSIVRGLRILPGSVARIIRRGEPAFWDPTLYRVLSFGVWSPEEDASTSDHRREHLEKLLLARGWMPRFADKQQMVLARVPERGSLGWSPCRPWNLWPPDREREGWSVHQFSHGQHEELLVLVGVEQDGRFHQSDNWPERGQRSWEQEFGSPTVELGTEASLPDGAAAATRPALLGTAWLWTLEWEWPPDTGWDAFGLESYGSGAYSIVPGGLIGVRQQDSQVGLRFDLHTTVVERSVRDRYLFGDLIVLLMSYLKATQFLRRRYEHELFNTLNELKSQIDQASEPPPRGFSIRRTERAVRELNRLLHLYAHSLAMLDDDARSAEIARAAVARVLESSQAAPGPRSVDDPFLEPASRLAGQLRSDLEYFRTTDASGQRALETYRILVEIQEAKDQKRLAIVVAVIGVPLSLAQIIGNDLALGDRFAVSAVGAALTLLVGLYWWWSDRDVA